VTTGKVKVLIIGGTGGLGSGLVANLESDYEITSMGSNDLNILDVDNLRAFFQKYEAEVILNVSGYNYDCLLHRYDDKNFNEIDKQIDIVVKGNVNLLNACLPGMRSRGYGRIILTSSILVSKPVAGTGVYSASKAFVEGLVKACSVENAFKGITASAIQVGYFDAGLTHRIPSKLQDSILNQLPTSRWGTIEELASVVRLLIENAYLNGTTIKINGGAEF